MNKLLFVCLSVFFIMVFNSCNKTKEPEDGSQKDQQTSVQNNKSEDVSHSEAERKNDQENKTAETPDGEKESDKKSVKEKSENKFNTKSVTVKFPAESTRMTMDGNITGFGDLISYEFEASKGQTLNASVKPKNGEGNVRINQIRFPDGKADGPFGDKMTYKLTESGNWKLIIGEDMMAGEPWKGAYLLTVEIK